MAQVSTTHPGLTGNALRAALEMADLTGPNLAHLAGISVPSVDRYKAFGDKLIRMTPDSMRRVLLVFRLNGYEFGFDGPRKIAPLPWSGSEAA